MFDFIYLETLLCFVFSFFIYFNYKKISEIINVYDIPDQNLKKHSIKTPVSAGILNLIAFTCFFLFTFNFSEIFFYPFILIIYTAFGFVDDKYNLNPYLKLFITTLIVALLIYFENNLIIETLKFDLNNYVLNLGLFSLPFTVLCILLLTHSLNMMDGINGYSAIYKISIMITFILYITSSLNDYPRGSDLYIDLIWLLNISILYLFLLSLFIFLNYKGLIFFGDGGIYFGALIISYILIKLNKILPTFTPEAIFIILILPGIDMLRLFILRIYKRRNPFKGDLNHFHHIFKSKYPRINIVFPILITHLLINSVIFYQNKLFLPVLLVYLILFFLIVSIKNEIN